MESEVEVGKKPSRPKHAATVTTDDIDPSDDWRDQSLSHSVKVVVVVLIAVQIVATVIFGAITIQRYPLWSAVDEGAHYSNVLYVADHGTYPVLGKTLMNHEVFAISEHHYPKGAGTHPRTYGFGAFSYEAFQPPLYYYLAAPVSMLSGNYHTKAILLRYFGLVLLLISIALFARLSRHVLKKRWLLGLAGGMLIFLMPGIIVRMVTISDGNLAVPLSILIATELWITWEHKSPRRLILCGVLVGCGVLTDLYLVEFVPVFLAVAAVLLYQNHSRPAWLCAILGAIGGLVVAAPWLIFNEVKYHAITASAIAKHEQLATVNPDHLRYTVGQIPGLTVQDLFKPLMPQEWALTNHLLLSYLADLFQVLIVPTALVLALALGRRLFTSGLWLLLLPWVCNIILCWYIDVGQQWQSGAMVGRYTYATIPLVALFSVAAALARFRQVTPVLATTTVVATAFLIVLWIHLLPIVHQTIPS